MYIGAIVLAGGRSRRMGQPKESLVFRDSTLLGHVVETLLLCAHPVVVIARDAEQELPPLPLEADLEFDISPGEGPLVALATGLRCVNAHCDAALVTSCDAPFIDAGAVDWLGEQLGSHDAVMPQLDDVLYPLNAIYHTRVLETVETRIEAGDRAPRDLVRHLDVRRLTTTEIDGFDPQRRFLRNLNSPEDYRTAIAETDTDTDTDDGTIGA